jgi:hypothetical protein
MAVLKKTIQRHYMLWNRPLKGIYLALIFILLCGGRSIQTLSKQESQVRSVFLYNFTQFVEWPPESFAKPDSPLIIGIVGNDPFGNVLQETMRNEIINGHPLIVQYFNKVEDIKTCHILYINLTKSEQFKHVFDYLANQNILTVGDAVNFSKQGGMIRFFTENNKTRIRINLDEVKERKLTVSSKLLRLAEVVESANK